jgi:hypothetical protein
MTGRRATLGFRYVRLGAPIHPFADWRVPSSGDAAFVGCGPCGLVRRPVRPGERGRLDGVRQLARDRRAWRDRNS